MSEQYDPSLPLPELIVPGIVIRTKVNLGQQDCEMGFELSVDRDEPIENLDAACDKVMGAALRQRAKMILPGWRHQREGVQFKYDENRKRLAEMEARLAESRKIRDEAIRRLEVIRDAAISAAAADWRDSGKRGEFKPQQQMLRPHDAKIEELRKAGDAEAGEANVQRAQLETELQEGFRALEQWNVMIREQEALLRAAK